MKLVDDARFPHPVISSMPGDYSEPGISWTLGGTEAADTGQVVLRGSVEITHPDFVTLLKAGDIALGLQVVCLDTYYNRFHPVDCAEGYEIPIESGLLLGTVRVRPLLFATRTATLPARGMNAEFGEPAPEIHAGDVAGYGDETRFVVGLEKLAPLESIFTLIRNLDITEPRFELDTSGQIVRINVSSALYDDIDAMRGAASCRNVLLSSVYLPCIIELLSIAAEDPQEDCRWYRVFAARCQHLGLRLDGKDLAKNAQILIGNPLGLLRQVFGSLE
jgi:hypothetical protein